MKPRRLVFYPFNELSDIIVLKNPVDGIVIIVELALCKSSVYLSVAHTVEKHYFTAFKRAGYQMVLARLFGKLTSA